jgi:RND family efflux transporter MFP subunit
MKDRRLSSLVAIALTLGLVWLMPASALPIRAASAVSVAQQQTVVASAQVVPVWVSELSFPISGLLKEVAVRPGDRVEAGQILALLDSPELAFDVQQAEAALQAAQVDWEYYRVLRKNKPPEKRLQAEARLEAAQAALEVARLAQAQTTLTAPRTGSVVTIRLNSGEFAAAGQSVLMLADLNHFEIETLDLSERNVASIQPGQKAVVYIEALDQEFSARVVRVSPRAEKKDGDVIFRVTLALDNQPVGLLWGMSAEVRIETGG